MRWNGQGRGKSLSSFLNITIPLLNALCPGIQKNLAGKVKTDLKETHLDL
jgi:hypothetical protein